MIRGCKKIIIQFKTKGIFCLSELYKWYRNPAVQIPRPHCILLARIHDRWCVRWSHVRDFFKITKDKPISYAYICSKPKKCLQLPRPGWYICILRVLQLRPGGLLVGGPPCGSFVWVNRATSLRSKSRVFGDTTKKYVRMANGNHVLSCKVFLCMCYRCCWNIA